MPELMIPCPFCGSTEIGSNSTFGTVWCEQCTRALKIAEWQSRPIEDALRAEVAAQGKTIGEWQDFLCQVSDMLWGGELAWACDGGLKKMGGELKRRLSEVADWHSLADVRALEIARLEAELAKYTEPLTGAQQVAVIDENPTVVLGTFTLRLVDAAIRRVRRGE